MNNWLYNLDGINIHMDENYTTDSYGFIYKITNLETGKFYIGKKSYIHNKKKKLVKKESNDTLPGLLKDLNVDSGKLAKIKMIMVGVLQVMI